MRRSEMCSFENATVERIQVVSEESFFYLFCLYYLLYVLRERSEKYKEIH